MATEDESVENLSKMFDDGLELFNRIENTEEATNSQGVQSNVKECIGLLEKATNLASLAGIFSTNESIEEISTTDVKFLLLPAILGILTLKLTSGDRRDIIDVSEIYFKDFLQRCNNYELSDLPMRENEENVSNNSQLDQLKRMISTRQSKIQRFKEQKELQNKLTDLKTNMESENCDEETKRNYVITLVKSFIFKIVEELDSLEMEKPLLERMEKSESASKTTARMEKPGKLKAVILTRDEMQKKVFGLGYPSLPTMTVQEFYDQRVREGVFPSSQQSSGASLQDKAIAGQQQQQQQKEDETEAIQVEEKIESDDPDLLQRLRESDEFKDEHRRGWGNRMNRS